MEAEYQRYRNAIVAAAFELQEGFRALDESLTLTTISFDRALSVLRTVLSEEEESASDL